MLNYLYIDPNGGIAGDMFTAAFLDAGIVELAELESAVHAVVPDVRLSLLETTNCGIGGTRFRVITGDQEEKSGDSHHGDSHHEHYSYKKIRDSIEVAELSEFVKNKALAVFDTLAEAEAFVHKKTVDSVHFHEVGRNDAIADIISAAVCLEKIQDYQIHCGAIPFGIGEITFSHGTLSLPAPATLRILQSVPTTSGLPVGEMTTPTGAAIAVNCVDKFEAAPDLKIESVGYGLGTREVKGFPNYMRIMSGVCISSQSEDLDYDQVYELKANVDDQAPHLLAPALERLLECGAIDVFVNSYNGKKSRQGQEWTVLARPEDRVDLAGQMMHLLGSIGIRMTQYERLKLKRNESKMEFEGHLLRAKHVFGSGIDRTYPEADDVLELSKRIKVSPMEIFEGAKEIES